MGQICLKLGSKNAIYSATSGRSTTEGGLVPQLPAIPVDVWIARESNVKRTALNSRIQDLLCRLKYTEVEILLNIFRAMCLEERKSSFHHPQQLLPAKTAKSGQKLHLDKLHKVWRKLSLRTSTLASAFPSLSQQALERKWNQLQDLWNLASEDQVLGGDVAQVFGVCGGDTGANSSVVFVDFCAIFSMILHGSKTDLLALLFYLFARPGQATGQSASPSTNPSATTAGAAYPGDMIWTEQASLSLLVLLSTSFMFSTIYEHHMEMRTSHASEEEFLLFAKDLCARFFTPPPLAPSSTGMLSAQDLLGANPNSSAAITALVSTDSMAYSAREARQQAIQEPELTHDTLPDGSGSGGRRGGESLIELVASSLPPKPNPTLTLEEFLERTLAPRTGAMVGEEEEEVIMPPSLGPITDQVFELLQAADEEVLRNAFNRHIFNLFVNPFAPLQSLLNAFQLDPEINALRSDLVFVEKTPLQRSTVPGSSGTATPIPATVAFGAPNIYMNSVGGTKAFARPTHPVLFVEARTWQIYCTCMEVTPIYHSQLSHVVIHLQPAEDYVKRSISRITSKFHRFNPLQAREEFEDIDDSPVFDISQLLALNSPNHPLRFCYKPKDTLLPWQSTAPSPTFGTASRNVTYFVALPFSIASQLYMQSFLQHGDALRGGAAGNGPVTGSALSCEVYGQMNSADDFLVFLHSLQRHVQFQSPFAKHYPQILAAATAHAHAHGKPDAPKAAVAAPASAVASQQKAARAGGPKDLDLDKDLLVPTEALLQSLRIPQVQPQLETHPLQLPVHLCNELGFAISPGLFTLYPHQAAPLDCYGLTIGQLLQQLLSHAFPQTHCRSEQFRLWALFPAQEAGKVSTQSKQPHGHGHGHGRHDGGATIAHSKDWSWQLLSDLHAPCDGRLWSLLGPAQAQAQGQEQGQGLMVALPSQPCALMVEGVVAPDPSPHSYSYGHGHSGSPSLVFPTERLRVHQLWPSLIAHSIQLVVGLACELLDNFGYIAPAQVTHIEHVDGAASPWVTVQSLCPHTITESLSLSAASPRLWVAGTFVVLSAALPAPLAVCVAGLEGAVATAGVVVVGAGLTTGGASPGDTPMVTPRQSPAPAALSSIPPAASYPAKSKNNAVVPMMSTEQPNSDKASPVGATASAPRSRSESGSMPISTAGGSGKVNGGSGGSAGAGASVANPAHASAPSAARSSGSRPSLWAALGSPVALLDVLETCARLPPHVLTPLSACMQAVRGRLMMQHWLDSSQCLCVPVEVSQWREGLAREYYCYSPVAAPEAGSVVAKTTQTHSHAKSQSVTSPSTAVTGGRPSTTVAASAGGSAGIVGLNNLGNTCYLSSALQCLFRAPIFPIYFLTYQHVHGPSALLVHVPSSSGETVTRMGLSSTVMTTTSTFSPTSFALTTQGTSPTKGNSSGSTGGKLTNEFAAFLRSAYETQAATTTTKLGATSTSTSAGGGGGSAKHSLPGSPLHSHVPQQTPSAPHSSVVPHNRVSSSPLSLATSFPALSPTALFKIFQQFKPQFSSNDQQDAQEFLSELLDMFHEDLRDMHTPTLPPPSTTSLPGTTNERSDHVIACPPSVPPSDLVELGRRAWHDYLVTKNNSTVVSHLFQGQLCTYMVCKQCGYSAAKFEPYTTLSLPIPRAGGGSPGTASSSSSPANHLGDSTDAAAGGGAGGAGSVTAQVVVRIYRKMPKLSTLLHVVKLVQRLRAARKGKDSSPTEVGTWRKIEELLDWDSMVATVKKQKDVMRVAITAPTSTTIDTIRTQCLRLLTNPVGDATGLLEIKLPPASGLVHRDDEEDGEEEGEGAMNSVDEESVDGTPAEARTTPASVTAPANAITMHHMSGGGDVNSTKDTPLALDPAHVTMIDVHPDDRFKIRRILDPRETLQAVLDETSAHPDDGPMEFICIENNKDIAYIAALPGHRLVYDSTSHPTLSPCSLPRTERQVADALAALAPVQLLQHLTTLVPKLLHTYSDDEEYPQEAALESWGLVHCRAPDGMLLADLDTRFVSPKLAKASPAFAARDKWPKHVKEFRLGDRVDALDLKGQWYAGSVLEVFRSDTGPAGPDPSPAVKLRSPSSSLRSAGSSSEGEVYVRVHFDNYSSVWDEWYNQQDFAKGHIAPVFSKTQRKLKIFDLQIIHRNLFYALNPVPINSTNEYDKLTLERMEVVEAPFVVQCESYRSVAHLRRQITDQMLRFLPDAFWDGVSWDTSSDIVDWPFPFKIRLLSTQNIHGPPQLSSPQQIVQHLASLGGSKDRFSAHKHWEGRELAADPTLPVSNVFHQKLLLAVDWEYLSDAGGVSPSLVRWMRRTHEVDRGMDHRIVDHPSFTELSAAQASLSQQTAASPTARPATHPGEVKDSRAGLSLGDVVARFLDPEEIDYKCERCAVMRKGMLYTSLHTLPEVCILHLKRLVMNLSGGMKVRTLVKFPVQSMDFAKFTTEALWRTYPGQSPSSPTPSPLPSPSTPQDRHEEFMPFRADDDSPYDLFGVVNHLGGMFGGHYTAYARCEVMDPPPPRVPGGSGPNAQQLPSPLPAPASSGAGVGEQGLDVHAFYDKGAEQLAYGQVNQHEYRTFISTDPSAPAASTPTVTTDDDPNGLSAVLRNLTPNLQRLWQQSAGQNRWFKFDDEFVAEISDTPALLYHTVVSESAYLLFYRRRQVSKENLMRYV